MYLNSFCGRVLGYCTENSVLPGTKRTGDIFVQTKCLFPLVALPLVIGIVREIFRPLQVASFRRCFFRCFSDAPVFICIAMLLPPCWLGTKPSFLPSLRFPGFSIVLPGCPVLLPQPSCSCCLLQKEMCLQNSSLPKQPCLWFSSGQLIVSELGACIYVSWMIP